MGNYGKILLKSYTIKNGIDDRKISNSFLVLALSKFLHTIVCLNFRSFLSHFPELIRSKVLFL